MKKNSYHLSLEEFVKEYRKLDVLKRKAIFEIDSGKLELINRKQASLIIKYAKKFKLLGEVN